MDNLYDAIDNQDNLVDVVNNYYTCSVSSQTSASNGEKVIFNIPNNNFVENDRIQLADTGVEDYNDVFEVENINGDDFTVTLDYNSNASASITNGDVTANSLRIYNNYLVRVPEDKFPICIIDIDDTRLINNAGNEIIPDKTFYPLMIINSIENFDSGDNIQVRACRRYISYKFDEVLNLLTSETGIKVIPNISRKETVFNRQKVSLIAINFEY